jgi:archaetidylinositol phosphate synthase
LLDRLRGRLDSALLSIGSGASKIVPSPTAWTLIGVLFALLSAGSFAMGSRLGEALGGGGIIFSGIFDVLDGAVARATAGTTKRGAFLDSTLDRMAEFVLYLGILIGGLAPPLPVFLALSLSLLVSYTRAKADSLGYSLAGVGVGERSERLLVLAVSALLGILFYGVILVILLAAFTFAERVYRISRSLR